jgi:hypothetical protein
VRRGQPLRRKAPLERRAPLSPSALDRREVQGTGPFAKPRKRLRPLSEKKRAERAADAAQAEAEGKAFRAAIKGLRCAVCGRTEAEAYAETGLGHEAHHVVRKEVLKRLGLRALLWAPEAAVCLCEEPCHRQHTTRKRRVLRAELPAAALSWAAAWGLADEVALEYPA